MSFLQEQYDDLYQRTGKMYLNRADIQQATGFGLDKIDRLIAALPAYGKSRGRTYYYRDVVRAIYYDGAIPVEPQKRKKRCG